MNKQNYKLPPAPIYDASQINPTIAFKDPIFPVPIKPAQSTAPGTLEERVSVIEDAIDTHKTRRENTPYQF